MKIISKAKKPVLSCSNCNRFKAFSFVELLITLIIISLLIAAFTPLISKKLKANDITVGSFGKGGGMIFHSTKREVTKEDCDKFNALYISKEDNGGTKPICVTKWNVGDNIGNGGVPFANGVIKLNTGQTCNDFDNCCWQGATADPSTCSQTVNGTTYSGCNRTVCQWRAANDSCKSYAPKGTAPGLWRLPSDFELRSWKNNLDLNTLAFSKDGLQLCGEHMQNSNFIACNRNKACIGAGYSNEENASHHKDNCFPYHVWSNNNGKSFSYFQETDGFDNVRIRMGVEIAIQYINRYNANYANTARCVLDGIEVYEEAKCNCENGTCEDNVPFCTSCNEGYTLENYKCVQDDGLANREPRNQKDCDKLAPNLMFIDKAYNGTLGKNTCVTKYNIGDSGGPHLANIVDKTDVGQYCDGGYCCWVGKTSAECSNTGNGNSTYSGCNRTVCQWKAANATCALWAPDGRQGYWRLPTKEELLSWAGNIDKISAGKGKDGLQLCSEIPVNSNTFNCQRVANCLGGSNIPSIPGHSNMCFPYHIWSSDFGNNYAFFKGDEFKRTIEIGQEANSSYANSSRCVYDGDYHYQNIQKEITDKPAYRQPFSQKDCDPFNAMFIPAKYNGAGGVNLCVTKYNAFDTGGPEISYSKDSYLNDIADVNKHESCLLDYCCWEGVTAPTSSGYSHPNTNAKYGKSMYLPQVRTLCTYLAAERVCDYWSKGGTGSGWWRLPTPTEAAKWATLIKTETQTNPIISRWMGAGGLQLCDETSDAKGSDRCARSTACNGATNNLCLPSYVWTNGGQPFVIDGGDSGLGPVHDLRYAMSVRCVTEKVPNN